MPNDGGGIIHPTAAPAPAAAPAAAPASATLNQPAPATERRRIGEMRELHQMPPPGNTSLLHTPTEKDPHRGADDIPGIGVNAQAQALARLVGEGEQTPLQGSETQILVEGQPVSWEQYQQLQAALKELDEAEQLPDKYAQKLRKVKPNGREMFVTVEDLERGFMLDIDYSNKTAAIAAERREIQRTRQGFVNLLADMDDGHSFLRAIDHLGKMPGFQAAAKLYAIQYAAEKRMTPDQRAVYERNRQLERESFQKDLRLRALEQQAAQAQQQQQLDPEHRHTAKQLEQFIPIAAKKAGFDASELNPDAQTLARERFEHHWASMCASDAFEGPLSLDHVLRAMRAAKQEVDALVLKAFGPSGRPQGGALPDTTRLSSAAPAAGQMTNGQPMRKRIGDMRDLSGVPRR